MADAAEPTAGGTVPLPLGLIGVFLILCVTALVNLATKQVATIWGLVFTAVFFTVFALSERFFRGEHHAQLLEKFNVSLTPELDPVRLGLGTRPCIVVPVRDSRNLRHLDQVLTEAEKQPVDVVVPTIKVESDMVATGANPNFAPDEQAVFSAVVNLAEHHGMPVIPLVITSNDALFAIARTAQELRATSVVLGESGKFPADLQAEQFAMRWGAVEPDESHELTLRIVSRREELRVRL